MTTAQLPNRQMTTLLLKNKAGLTHQTALEAFETAMTFARSEEPLPAGKLSVRHYKAIHRQSEASPVISYQWRAHAPLSLLEKHKAAHELVAPPT